MTRSQQIEKLLGEYAKKRSRAQNEQAQRQQQVREMDPRIAALQDGMAGRFALSTKRMLRDRAQAKAIAARLRQDTLRDQETLKGYLAGLGLPRDYLAPQYECALCQDTGFLGEDRTRYCPCFERALDQARWGTSVRAGHTFEAFDPAIFPDQEQKVRTQQAKRLCEDYAQHFPQNQKPGLLLMGESGLGKTFLLDAIAARVQQNGHPALRLTAFQMLEGMRAYHLGEEAPGTPFQEMLACPLLLIDDLGTEPVLRNITVEYLFLMLNERAGMHQVVATNLKLPQLAERYGERVLSRLVDRGQCEVIMLTGKDLRIWGARDEHGA